MTNEQYMEIAIDTAFDGISKAHGGPFGAVVVDANGNVVGVGHNRVLVDSDSTAHGEVVAIRDACKRLGTHDLSGCTIYTTGAPCPMCRGAILWSNISDVYYGCNVADADSIGFRDEKFYAMWDKYSENYGKEVSRDKCLALFKEYSNITHELY